MLMAAPVSIAPILGAEQGGLIAALLSRGAAIEHDVAHMPL
jgi:hypothetical protein